ncbi:unnamed protein product [Rotaria sp. Silwood2]|nr:unnamed protein product [Rotaria sp. Silwood2]CAF4462568.1 unnamed protein product [Rotaria sp. Silwood2]CAF4572352.1 unnamed protein product [Rotaria sp. Silwood2]
MRSTTEIRYRAASLRMTIVQYSQSSYHDINLYQENFTIIRQSSGLCISGSFICELERPAAYRDYNRKQNVLTIRNPTPEQIFVNTHAQEICERTLQSARKAVAQLGLPSTSENIEGAAMTSCINDLELSGDRRFANSVLQLSIFDTAATRNVSEEQQNLLFEQSAVVLEAAVANTSAMIEQFILSENITLDTTTSTTTPSTTTAETTTTVTTSTATVESTTTSGSTSVTTDSSVPTTTIMTTTSKGSEGKGLCNFYGDPHMLIFGQRLSAFQHQYWCKTPGEHRILLNDFVQIFVTVHTEAWRIDQFNMTFFKDNSIALCTIDNHQQICNSSGKVNKLIPIRYFSIVYEIDVKLTRPSRSQIDILYAAIDLHISIVTNQYEFDWYDITVRMPYELIRRSSGLCVMPPVDDCELENSIEQKQKLFQRFNMNTLPRQVCEAYLTASNQAAVELGISIDSNIHDSSLSACIHDYETTGNKNFGASLVNMIIKHGINALQLDDNSFDLYTNKSINIINAALTNASTQVDILLAATTEATNTTTTTTTSVSIQTTTSSSYSTTIRDQSSTTSTTSLLSTTFSTTISSSTFPSTTPAPIQTTTSTAPATIQTTTSTAPATIQTTTSTAPAPIQTTTSSSYSQTTTLNCSTISRPMYTAFVLFTSILLFKSFFANL